MMDRNMLKQLQKLQADMMKAQEALGQETVEGSAGGGAVRVVMTGHQKVQSVAIEPEAAEDVEILQDLVMSAINDAQEKVAALVQQRMGRFTGGLPGMGGLF
ncbi:MAG: YbaB/EbfC family nucleoid-associated protein [Dehalococcoidia bacterium]|nr:YbaB/EbfC family nucleoid-associated protein [Dehalococcoidia bacterium]